MLVGITVQFQFSFFSAGSPSTALAIAELYSVRGHTVKFIRTGKDQTKTWYDDVSGLEASWSSVPAKDASGFDLVIEMGNSLLSVEERKKQTACVWLFRKHILYHDIESSLFPFENPERSLTGISEIWLHKELSSTDDVQYMETLTRKPVRCMPLVWTPSAIELYRQQAKIPVWGQVAELEEVKKENWSIHICETNNTSASSCTIPLFIMREIKKKSKIQLKNPIKIHNADHVRDSQFFRFNVLDHAFSDSPDISGVFLGRQRIIDFVFDPKSILIAHARFQSWRPYLMDALWTGIPLVHNSPLLLQRLGDFGRLGYYPDNELHQGRLAFERVCEDALQPGNLERLVECRKKIIEQFSPLNSHIQDIWIAGLSAAPAAPPVVPSVEKRRIVIGFTDMWDDFNPEYNMFTLMVEAAVKESSQFEVVGQSGFQGADILLFGPFGNTWQQAPPTMPKVHYTGENTEPVLRDDVKLNLGYRHVDMNTGAHLRLPLWMLEINWFGGDVDKIRNPKPMPINRATQVYPEELGQKKKFCAFVVSNPCQPMRNSAFQWLSEYKQVDSAGRLFNNVGDALFAGLGGGGGELKKLEFLKDYKFCITYENASAPGYTTEKMLHAKAAGCIPIYWGDPKVERDFDTAGFLDAREILTSQQLIHLVKEVDTNKSLWLKKFSVPALDEVRRDLVRRTLSECARRILALVGVGQETLDKIPKFLGAASDEELPQKTQVQEQQQPQATQKVNEESKGKDISTMPKLAVNFDSTVFATGCNQKFLSSLQLWLNALKAHKEEAKELTVIVYFMNDVSKEIEQAYQEAFPFAQFRRFPTEAPADFSDLWNPQHFAWKLWLTRQLVLEEGLKGKPILYMDTGVMMVRWPRPWLEAIRRTGISLLDDKTQKNKYWCHEAFKTAFATTQEEVQANQIWAGCLGFVSGHSSATELFEEAWTWAQKREVIVGPKWAGILPDGQSIGHRHDQSILSVLSMRKQIHRYPMNEFYCHTSLRHTFLSKSYVYVHRGIFKVHEKVAEGIDDVWVINLDRRKDRMESFIKAHPALEDRVLRLPAFEGKNLKLTPRLARLFAPHDFNWKKPVMGCALSHLALWMQLLNEKEDIQSYLILEDDARLKSGWKDIWEEAMQANAIPKNFDVVYLGGILPPNREGFEGACVEKINDYVGKVAVNSVFGQDPPNRYFHFCAYSYVLSRTGARKIIEYLKSRNGYWTSADHMMCNLQDFLNIYFLHPFQAGCFQDEDPVYQKSQFNDFSRVDSFDSDLWNNTERFTEDEVKSALDTTAPLDILGALEDARTSGSVVPSANVDVIGKENPQEAKETLANTPRPTPKLSKRRLVSVAGPRMDASSWYEFSWFKQIFTENAGLSLEVERIDDGSTPPTDQPIVVVQRPYTEKSIRVLKGWSEANVKFYVLHLSDEHGTDPVDFYMWPSCLGVLRNYVREGVVESDKVKVIPLGFHWAIPNGEPFVHTPRVPFRELVWSFVGTGWANRQAKLRIFDAIPGEHKCVFMDEWNSPKMLGREETLAILLNTWCVPCPSGNNAETYRFYEALEAGAVPMLVKEGGMDAYLNYVSKWLPMLVANDWEHAASLVHTLRMKPEVYEQYRGQVLHGWEKMKADTRQAVRSVWNV